MLAVLVSVGNERELHRSRDRRLFNTDRRAHHLGEGLEISMESLILAQDERWRRA